MGCGSSKTEDDLNNNKNNNNTTIDKGNIEAVNQKPPAEPRQEPVANDPRDGSVKNVKAIVTANEKQERYRLPRLQQEPSVEDVDVPRTMPGYPPTKPCTDKKADIFNPNTFKNLDGRVRETPAEMANSYPDLISYLCTGCTSDIEKLRAIFIWLGCQEIDTSDYSDVTDSECPLGFMKLIKEHRASYASFFAVLCRHAHIPCVIVSGYAKSADYQVGDTEERIRQLGNTWNAVHVAGGWRLVFPCWACRAIVGYSTGAFTKVETGGKAVREKEVKSTGVTIKHLNEYYFLTDPENLIYVAYPTEPRWQLLPRPWSMKQFVDIPYCRKTYFEENARITSNSNSRIRTVDGVCEVELTAADPHGLHMNYELFYNNEESGKEISADLQLNNYVFLNRTTSSWTFQARIPERGVYKLEITGGRSYSTDICYFKIYCHEPQYECKPLPVNPGRVGYGPSLEMEQAGLKATSHRNGLIKISIHKRVDIHFTLTRPVDVRSELVHTDIDHEELQKCLIQSQKYRNLDLSVTVPEQGEYALRLYSRDKGVQGGEDLNVCNYLLSSEVGGKRRTRTWENATEKKARSMMQARSHTTTYRDVDELDSAINRFENLALDDKGDLSTAVDARELKLMKRELDDAIKRRHLHTLDTAVAHGHESRFKLKLETLIKDAEELSDHLRDLDRFAHDVLAMTQPTISELRSYKYPLEVVEDVMTAAFLLLGEKRKYIVDWTDVQLLMGRHGKQGMLRRVRQFDTIHADNEATEYAKRVLLKHTETDARHASAGCGTFYIWLRNVTDAHASEEVARSSE